MATSVCSIVLRRGPLPINIGIRSDSANWDHYDALCSGLTLLMERPISVITLSTNTNSKILTVETVPSFKSGCEGEGYPSGSLHRIVT
jgi:hypothetical protein